MARFSDVRIGDVVIDQNLALYLPDGQRPYLSGEQRMFFKVPQRQRVEQTLDGQREVQITVGNQGLGPAGRREGGRAPGRRAAANASRTSWSR